MNTPSEPIVPQNSSNKKVILIVVIVAVLLCCCCVALVGAGILAYNYARPVQSEIFPIPDVETEPWIEETPLPFPFQEATPELTETPESETIEPAVEPTEEVFEEPTAEPVLDIDGGSRGDGLGVSREQMIDFFNMGGAFEFKEPADYEGTEFVQGTHESLCVEGDCAAVVLAGPEENLLVVTVVVPTDPDDTIQSLTAITLLMTSISQFTDQNGVSDIPTQMMSDIIEAQKAGKSLEKSYEENGFMFIETYDADTHIAGVMVSPAQ